MFFLALNLAYISSCVALTLIYNRSKNTIVLPIL
jgi:hypothetical protein